jgi:hypothetical protein
MTTFSKLLPLSLALITLTSSPALAAKPGSPSASVGSDVSYPQCGKPLPTGQAFGIVGVNNGLAGTTNPCLLTELSWAQNPAGHAAQPAAQLYVNTGNPGDVLAQYQVKDWPTASVDADPYGQCSGTFTNNTACAWEYGYERAKSDATIPGIASPATFKWWLDVETYNSWTSDPAKNTAALEGMTYYFSRVLGAPVGIYSTALQWGSITGGAIGLFSNLGGLDTWLAGASSQNMAKSYCNLAPLTLGGRVTLTQYTTNFDYDVSCL